MPTVPVGGNPIQLSQVITQSALIQNNGSGTLYLADSSSVSSVAYALRVTPGATVSWPANSELWAVSDSACMVGILYGAVGASVSEVTVAGPLTIGSVLAPVSIQGGAGQLYANTVTVPAGQSVTIFLPTSVGNLTYSSMYCSLSVSQNNQTIQYQLVYGPPPYAYAVGSIVYPDMAMSVLFPYQTAFTVPWITTGQPLLSLTNPGASPVDVVVDVFGVASLTTKPATDLSWSIGAGAVSMPASDDAVVIPGSFDPFYVLCRTNGPVTTAFTLAYNGQSVTVPIGTPVGTVYTFMNFGGAATSLLLTTNQPSTPVEVLLSLAPLPFDNPGLAAYPIDSLYLSVSPTDPGTIFGGAWVAWGTGRVLIGVDTAQIEFNTVEKTGGEKTHLLTAAESGLPAHNHTQNQHTHFPPVAVVYNGNAVGYRSLFATNSPFWSMGDANNAVTQTVATNNPNPAAAAASGHNNLPPYITCYIWKRTA